MFDTGLHNEKIVRGFGATDGLRSFLLCPGRLSWNVYERVHHAFKVDLIAENLSPEAVDEMIESKRLKVADDGNGMFWYSQDMIHNKNLES